MGANGSRKGTAAYLKLRSRSRGGGVVVVLSRSVAVQRSAMRPRATTRGQNGNTRMKLGKSRRRAQAGDSGSHDRHDLTASVK